MVKQVSPDLNAKEACLINLLVLLDLISNCQLIRSSLAEFGAHLLELISQSFINITTITFWCI